MAELATIQSELPGLLTTLLGVPCQWRNQPRQMHKSGQATIDWLSGSGVGADERTYENVDAAGEPTDVDEDVEAVTETVHGLREATVQVIAWNTDQRLGESARAYLERLRTRLRWSSSTAALRALGLALVGVEPIVQRDPTTDSRVYSEASIDLRLAYGVAETDAAIPFIEFPRATSGVANAEDTLLPDHIQVDTNPEP